MPATDPFRILVLGDFSGTATVPIDRPPVRVDRDNFDDLPGKFGVSIRLNGFLPGGGDLLIPLRTIDDFHPNQVYEQLGVFDHLRDLRHRLGTAGGFAAAAAEVRSWSAPSSQPPPTAAPAEPLSESQQALSDLLGGLPPPPPASLAATDTWSEWIRETVAPYSLPKADPQVPELIARVDDALSAAMSRVLHHPRYQAVEAAWRGLGFLVRRLDTDGELRLYALDVARDYILRNPQWLIKLLAERAVEQTAQQPWSLVVYADTLQANLADAELLGHLATAAEAGNTTIFTAASERLAGCNSLAVTPDADDWNYALPPDVSAAWATVRERSEAARLLLACPRFLLRYPFGKDANFEAFHYEELPKGVPHEGYLWGCGAFAYAAVVGRAFEEAGWGLSRVMDPEIGGLPAPTFEQGGETVLKPTAEVILNDRSAGRLAAAGLCVLRSVAGTDAVRVSGLVGFNGKPLVSRWK